MIPEIQQDSYTASVTPAKSRLPAQSPANRLNAVLPNHYDPATETSEQHRDRLFLQVLLGLLANILALLGIFYLLLPLSEEGRAVGSLLLWGVLVVTVVIMGLFLCFGLRSLFVNLLLGILSGILVAGSYYLGGVMSPTMFFLMAMPVLSVTLLDNAWAYLWTALMVGAWLSILVLDRSGAFPPGIILEENIGVVQVIGLLGAALVVMAVLRSHVVSNNRLREAMEEKAERLDYLASHDSLTAIPNRRAFFDYAQRCLKRAERSGNTFALMIIDLDDFKRVNDELGHTVGDAVLQHFAGHLSEGFRGSDYIGRLGGDEFAVLLESVSDVDCIIERFRNIGNNEVEVNGRKIAYSFSIGVANYPENGQDIVQLYEAADSAMYYTKRRAPREFLWK